jgi:hypothetical protein
VRCCPGYTTLVRVEQHVQKNKQGKGDSSQGAAARPGKTYIGGGLRPKLPEIGRAGEESRPTQSLSRVMG